MKDQSSKEKNNERDKKITRVVIFQNLRHYRRKAALKTCTSGNAIQLEAARERLMF